jgi:proteasome lid subunit RPN8/RPN11
MTELNIWKDHIWKDPGLPIPVAFAPEAIEQIRRAAVEGMLALRRVGVGVGGLLLGRYGAGKVTVLDSREIACAHNFGPSFRLTPEEMTAALAPVDRTGERTGDRTAELRVVGLYCSKPSGPAEVNDDDRRLFESLCPERWQAMLVVSPKSNNSSTGAVFSRGAGRALLGGAQLPIEEIRSRPPEPAAVEAAPTIAPKVEPGPLAKRELAKPVSAPLPKIIPEPLPPPPPPRKAPPIPKAPPERAAPRRPDVPLFSRTVPVKRAGLYPWMLWVGAAVILLALCIAAFLTRNRWMPRPPLELRSYDSAGLLTVEWNRSAVRGIEDGSLLFTDGTDTKTIVVNGAQLHSGSLQYSRKSGHVAVIFRAGSIQETTTYNDKPLKAAPVATQPVKTPPPQTQTTKP